jgi:hypothetical protein
MPQTKLVFKEKELDGKVITIQFSVLNETIIMDILSDIGKVDECLFFLKTVLSMTGSFTINFAADNLPFQGEWCPDEKKINIRNSLDKINIIKTLFFECSNAINPGLIKKEIRVSNFLTADEYAQYIEEAERNSYLTAARVYGYGVAKCGWLEPTCDEIQLLDKKTWFQKSMHNGHYDYYKKYWNSINPLSHSSSFLDIKKKSPYLVFRKFGG